MALSKMDNNVHVKIIEPLSDVVATINQSVCLECKIINCETVVWYQNGIIITESDGKIQKRVNKYTYTLYIESVRYSDTGIYTIICNDSCNSVECKAIVTVVPKSDAVLYSSNYDQNKVGVTLSLRSMTSMRGGPLSLKAQFKAENITNTTWYKNNKLLESSKDIEIYNENSCSKLIIANCKNKHTGVYTVVIETDSTVDASYCDVRVINILNIMEERSVPKFVENLPGDISVNTGEESVLYCKVVINNSTKIMWWKDNHIITFNDKKHTQESCGPDHVGIRIINPTLGKHVYKLYLRNKEKPILSQCICSINKPPSITKPPIFIEKKLELIITSCGQSVILDCKFSILDQPYSYIVWQIGRLKIQRSNEKFKVAFHNGHCMLFIKKVEYGMEGKACCQMRMHVGPNESLLVSETTGYLTIVPPNFLKTYKDRHELPQLMKVFKKNHNYTIPDYMWRNQKPRADESIDVMGPNELIMEIALNRLDRKSYYVHVTRLHKYKNVNLVIRDRTRDFKDGDMLLEFTWYDDIFKGKDILFKVEVHHENVSNLMGFTDNPILKLTNILEDELFRIRITEVERNPDIIPVEVLIDVRRIREQHWEHFYAGLERRRIYKDAKSFYSLFTLTDKTPEAGASRNIRVLEGKMTDPAKKRLYAGKIINFDKKNTQGAEYEYNILSSLEHKNIVFMNCVLHTRTTVIIVTDYLWGGELFKVLLENNPVNERNLVPYINQICEALAYLDSQNVVNLNIKPENILLVHPNSKKIKLTDFGLSKRYTNHHGWYCRSVVGATAYIAPEMWSSALVSSAADMWSLGILIYILLTGETPNFMSVVQRPSRNDFLFNEATREASPCSSSSSSSSLDASDYSFVPELFEAESLIKGSKIVKISDLNLLNDSSITYINPFVSTSFSSQLSPSTSMNTKASSSDYKNSQCLYIYDNVHLENLSFAAKDFLTRLLTIDKSERLKAADALKHPWIKYGSDNNKKLAKWFKLKIPESIKYVVTEEKICKKAVITSKEQRRSEKTDEKPWKGKGKGKRSKKPPESKFEPLKETTV